jgi:hypothetical protein
VDVIHDLGEGTRLIVVEEPRWRSRLERGGDAEPLANCGGDIGGAG